MCWPTLLAALVVDLLVVLATRAGRKRDERALRAALVVDCHRPHAPETPPHFHEHTGDDARWTVAAIAERIEQEHHAAERERVDSEATMPMRRRSPRPSPRMRAATPTAREQAH